MNIFNKYRHNSQFIASVGTLGFFGLFVLLLFMKPFGNSTDVDPNVAADFEMPIEFQKDLMADVPMPAPSNTQTSDEETAPEKQSAEVASSEDVDPEPQSEQVSTLSAVKQDSALIADFKKVMADIKKSAPADTLPKDIIQPKIIEDNKKKLADNVQNQFEERKFYYDNYRAILSLRKVYPYVLRTKEIVARMNKQLATIKDKKQKKELIKKAEKELFTQFEKDVRNMSTSQGKLLLKLIARETDQTAFGLIKTYKGAIPATFWYGVGLIFHENLKQQYDSIGEDAQLEKIVQKYKLGKL